VSCICLKQSVITKVRRQFHYWRSKLGNTAGPVIGRCFTCSISRTRCYAPRTQVLWPPCVCLKAATRTGGVFATRWRYSTSRGRGSLAICPTSIFWRKLPIHLSRICPWIVELCRSCATGEGTSKMVFPIPLQIVGSCDGSRSNVSRGPKNAACGASRSIGPRARSRAAAAQTIV
jgi:hypothetical protein